MRTTRMVAVVFALQMLMLGGGCSRSEADSLALAKADVDKGDFKAALIHTKNVLQKNPSTPLGRYLMGKTLLGLGDPVSALQELEKARDLGADQNLLLPLLASAMLANGQASKVVERFAQTRLSDPKAAAELTAQLGWAYFRLNMMERWVASIESALKLDPKNEGARFQGILLAAQRGQFDDALKLVDALIADRPKQALAWALKGELLAGGKQDVDAAIKAYRQALVVEPRALAAHAGLLGIFSQRNDVAAFRAQVGDLKKALPDALQTLLYGTQLALLDNDTARAREGVQQLLRMAPSASEVLLIAGQVALQSGSLVQARTYLARATQQEPAAPVPRRLLALTHLRAGQAAEALQTLRPLLDQPEPSAEVLEVAAQAYLQAGDITKAETYYKLAARADPASLRPRVALAVAQIARGNAGPGMAALESMVAGDKGTTADTALLTVYLARNDLEGALKVVDRLQAKTPSNPLPYLLKGRILKLRNDAVGARASFETALTKEAGYFAAVTELATMDLADGRLADASKRFEVLLARDPKNYRAMIALADLRSRSGAKPEQIESLLLDAINANPIDPGARVILVRYRLSQRRAKEALAAAQEAKAAIPDDPTVLEVLGRAQLASGDSQQAAMTLRRIADSPATSADGLMRLAELYAGMKEYDAASEAARRALKLSPKLETAQRFLVEIALARKRVPEALEIARQIQKQQPQEAIGFLMEAGIHVQQKAWTRAIAAGKQALSTDRSAAVAIRLHALYLEAGDTAEADRLAATWRRERPADTDFLFHLASMAMQRKNYAEAESQYRAILVVAPDSALTLNNLAWVIAQQGKDGGVPLAAKALQLAPDEPTFMDTMSRALAAEKKPEQALEWARKAVDKAPARADYRLQMARLLIQTNQQAQARTELQALTALGSRFVEQAEVRRLLATL